MKKHSQFCVGVWYHSCVWLWVVLTVHREIRPTTFSPQRRLKKHCYENHLFAWHAAFWKLIFFIKIIFPGKATGWQPHGKCMNVLSSSQLLKQSFHPVRPFRENHTKLKTWRHPFCIDGVQWWNALHCYSCTCDSSKAANSTNQCSEVSASDIERKEKGFNAERNKNIYILKRPPRKFDFFFLFSPQVSVITALPQVLKLYHAHTHWHVHTLIPKYHPSFVRFIKKKYSIFPPLMTNTFFIASHGVRGISFTTCFSF